jgi:hypothetical protein
MSAAATLPQVVAACWQAARRSEPRIRAGRSEPEFPAQGRAWHRELCVIAANYPHAVDGCVEINYNGATALGVTAMEGDPRQGGAGWPGKPGGNQGRHESTLLSRQPWRGHECRRPRTRLVDELCNTPRWRRGARGHARRGITAPPPFTSTKADGTDGCEKIRKGFRPESYPHVTCEYTVTEQHDSFGYSTGRRPACPGR